jgi:hypothetical protein
MSVSSFRTLSLRIIIEQPPPGIVYGLQRGSGRVYDTEMKQISNGGDLAFELAVPVKVDKEGRPHLSGPFIQGPPSARFFYVDMGSYAGQNDALHNGRLKIPLPFLTDQWSERGDGDILTARVPGTNSKTGNPTMATVAPIGGWMSK